MTGLAPNTTHYFQVDYVLTDGRRSPFSPATTNTTYGTLTWGGVPYDWMVRYFGSDVSRWPSAAADSDGDGASTLYEFLAGTDPWYEVVLSPELERELGFGVERLRRSDIAAFMRAPGLDWAFPSERLLESYELTLAGLGLDGGGVKLDLEEGQIVGLMLLRKNAPDMPRPYRMWLYPIPGLVALLGWIFVFATTDLRVIVFGVTVLALGCVAFLLWSWNTKRWPFGLAEALS